MGAASVSAAKSNPHRLISDEKCLGWLTPLSVLEKGDVFIRQGTPHMRSDPPVECKVSGKTWIVNLISGRVWPVDETELIHPAFDVKLAFRSHRREG
jgi:hypothetical protein